MKGLLISAVLASAALEATPVDVSQVASPVKCAPEGGLRFICGPKRPEDLVVLPGDRWLVASGLADGGGLHLIDTHTKAWRRWIAPANGKADPLFPDCVAPPHPDRFHAHGLALGRGVKGGSRLYVVGHGEREAIEVFDVQTQGPAPTLAWRGCVRAPDKLEFNAVVAAPDGALLATVMNLPGMTLLDAFQGKATGAVFEWRPSDAGFRQMQGTGLPANNGMEISADGETVYVASPADRSVTAFQRGKSWRKRWTVRTPDMIPDNVHWGPNDKLYTAGMTDNEPACGGPLRVIDGKLDLMGCSRGYRVATIDPKTRAVTIVAKGERTADYLGIATALPAGGSLWIGSFAQNRVAYRPWPPRP